MRALAAWSDCGRGDLIQIRAARVQAPPGVGDASPLHAIARRIYVVGVGTPSAA